MPFTADAQQPACSPTQDLDLFEEEHAQSFAYMSATLRQADPSFLGAGQQQQGRVLPSRVPPPRGLGLGLGAARAEPRQAVLLTGAVRGPAQHVLRRRECALLLRGWWGCEPLMRLGSCKAWLPEAQVVPCSASLQLRRSRRC